MRDVENKIRAVELRAEVRQIKTMADHTTNLILNVPEDCLEQIRVLLGWLGDEVTLVIADTSIREGNVHGWGN